MSEKDTFHKRIVDRIKSDNHHLLDTNPEIAVVTTTITWNLPAQAADALPSVVVTTADNQISAANLYQTLRQIAKLGQELHMMGEQFAAQVTRQLNAARPQSAAVAAQQIEVSPKEQKPSGVEQKAGAE